MGAAYAAWVTMNVCCQIKNNPKFDNMSSE